MKSEDHNRLLNFLLEYRLNVKKRDIRLIILNTKNDIFTILKTAEDHYFRIGNDCYLIFTGTTFTEIAPVTCIAPNGDIPVSLHGKIRHILLNEKGLGSLWESVDFFKNATKTLQKYKKTKQKIAIIGTTEQTTIYLNFLAQNKIDITVFEVINFKKDVSSTIVLPFERYPHKFKKSERTKILETRQEVTVTHSEHSDLFIHRGKDELFALNSRLYNDNWSYKADTNLIEKVTTRNLKPFYNKGFILLEDQLAFYNKYWFYICGIPSNLFNNLLIANIDPDSLKAIHVTSNGQDYENLIRRFKNTGTPLSVISKYPETILPYHEYHGISNLSYQPSTSPYTLRDTQIIHEDCDISFLNGEENHNIYFTPICSQNKFFQWGSVNPQNLKTSKRKKKNAIPSGIHIVPKTELSTLTSSAEALYLFYTTDETKTLCDAHYPAGLNGKFYKCFPFIDYRFTKVFSIEKKLFYPLQLYMQEIITSQAKIMQRNFIYLYEHLERFFESFSERTTDTKEKLISLLDFSARVPYPRNKYEYILLHNCLEFLHYIYSSLDKKGVVNIQKIYEVIESLEKVLKETKGIEISDCRIKGNINTLPDGKKYLFYSLSEIDSEIAFSRQHKLELQKNIRTTFHIEKDLERFSKVIEQYEKEIVDPKVVASEKLRYKKEGDELKKEFTAFNSEIDRLLKVFDFCTSFQLLKISEKNKFYLTYKEKHGLIESSTDEDNLLFGDILENFKVGKKNRSAFVSDEERNARKKKRITLLLRSLLTLIIIFYLYLNLPIGRHRPIYEFVDSYREKNKIIELAIFGPKLGNILNLDYEILSWIPDRQNLWIYKTATNGSQITTNRVLNERAFSLKLTIFSTEVERMLNNFSELNKISKDNDSGYLSAGDTIQIADKTYTVPSNEKAKKFALRILEERKKNTLIALRKTHVLLHFYSKWFESEDPQIKARVDLNIVEKSINNAQNIYDTFDNKDIREYATRVITLGDKLKSKLNQIN